MPDASHPNTSPMDRPTVFEMPGYRCCLVVLLATCALRAAEGVPLGHPEFYPSREHPVGLRGDGSGVFPGATPVLTFGDGTVCRDAPGTRRKKVYVRDPNVEAANILWRTPLPNWSNSSPVVVGKRVFVMSEPTDTAPILTCVDADTGAILWQREVNHLDLLPEPERSEIKQLWSKTLGKCRSVIRLWSEYRQLREFLPQPESPAARKETPKPEIDDTDGIEIDPDLPDLQPAAREKRQIDPALRKRVQRYQARCRELGITGFGEKAGWGTVTVHGLAGLSSGDSEKLERHGCYFHKWELGLARGKVHLATYIGLSPATPCSDGRSVYVFTGYNCVACYDLDGRLRWLRWLGMPAIRRTSWIAWCQPPVLTGGVLLIGVPLVLTALDPNTGRMVWQVSLTDAAPRGGWTANRGMLVRFPVYGNCTFAGIPLTVAGESCFFWMDGRVYRTCDGAAVTRRLCGEHPMYLSCFPSWADGKLFFYSAVNRSTGLYAFRFGKGDGLAAKKVWSHVPAAGSRELVGRNKYGLVHKGRLYERRRILDAGSGEVIRPAERRGGLPEADPWTGYCVAGDHLFTTESVRGQDAAVIRVCDLDGNVVAENYLSCPPQTPEELERIRCETGYDAWAAHDRYTGAFHSALFFAGSRIYVRSRSDLICVGPDNAAGRANGKQ